MAIVGYRFSRVTIAAVFVLLSIIALITGCRIFPGHDDEGYYPQGTATSMSGRILVPADLAGYVDVASAEVWIEDLADNLKYHSRTNASGVYVINDVPPGPHRVITRLENGGLAVMKNRSAEINVSETPGVVPVPDMPLLVAKNIVTGQLRDADGNFLPENTILSLWGETFKVGKDGTFISPPLPESFSSAEIQVQLPNGNGATTFSAPFVSDIVPVVVDLKVGGSQETGNHAPSVILQAAQAGEIISKVSPGSSLVLTAVGSDLDASDRTMLSVTWEVTAGTLITASSDFEKTWKAPDYQTLATITVEVKDPKGAVGVARLPILVGIDNPSQYDGARPSVTLSSEVTQVADSAAFVVGISFDELVSGFALEDISVTNGTADNFSTVTAGRNYSVRVKPQAAGAVTVAVGENLARDVAGNGNRASNVLTVTNNVAPVLSSAKVLTAFAFSNPDVNCSIDEGNKTVTVTLPFGTDASDLVANFTVSAKASVKVGAVDQVSGTTVNNFTAPVVYQIIAEDGSIAEYTVTVTVAANPAKAITAFDFAAPAATGVVNEGTKTVAITVPFGTVVTALTPTITHSGASVSPNSGAAQDFTNPVTYTVTAADASTQQYVVTVTVAANPAKAITAFDFATPAATGVVNEGAKTVAITVPFGTVVTALTPTITHSGASVSPNSGAAQDFTNPVTYTVTAADASTQQYVVTVTVAANPAKAITAFDFATPAATGVVNEGAKTVAITVPFGTAITALTPTITHSGASVSPNSGVAQDFTNPVTYTVTAADASTQQYVVTVTVAANPAKAITAFDFAAPAATGVVNEGAKTVVITVPFGTAVTALTPAITHSGASVSPNSGVAQDFTNPVTYTVTAADASTQEYVVTVTVAANPAKAITAFDFATPATTGVVNEGAKTVAITVPFGTVVTALTPTITHSGASVSPNSGAAQDFTNPVTYTVTAADASTQQYVVTVTVAANPAKAITAFDFATPAATGVVNEGAKTVALTVPFGTVVTALTPTITHSGASVSPNSGAAQDFTNPVTYTVTAADASTQQYVVTVTVAANPAKAITAFDFATPAATGVVNEGAKTVAITVPFGTAITALTPTITHSGASVSPNSGVAQDFTNPVTYTVTAADASTQEYVVTVTVAANPAKAITAFDFAAPAATGVVNEGAKTVAITVPFGTAVTALTPTITHSGASVSPNSGAAQDFTNPVTYTVTAADASTQQYVVTVTVAANPAKAITAFDFATPAATGVVNEGAKTVAITVPFGTVVTALTPTITHSGASVSPNSGAAQDFTNPVTYTVTAADASTQQYVVTVTVAANPAKAITAFDFATPAATGVVNEGAKTVAITVPFGTVVTALTPTITHSGASVSPNSGAAQDFTNPVTYTVTAADASTQEYVVTVTVAANPAKAITAFDFAAPAATGVVNEGAKTVAITVPFGTAITALTPTITHSGASVSPNSGVAQDFTNPVTYTVTAADASTQEYVVTVTVAANPAKAITAFDFAAPAATGVVNEGTKTVAITVPFGTVVTALTPAITHSGASVSPNSGVAQDFTNPVTYTVTAADASTQQYVVTVTVAANPAKAITAFDFATPAATGVVNEGAKTVAITVPFGTAVNALTPTITHSGANVSPNSGVAQDFTNPVTYTVTAADASTQEYVVTVTVAANPAKAITAFDFATPAATGVVNEGAKTVAITVPFGTAVTALTPTITHSGASVSPNSGAAQDFTNPVTYTVTAADASTQQYVVTVTVAANPAKAITAFDFATPAATGVVNEGAKTVAITVPFGTAVTALTPTITHSGASVSPNSGAAQDFTNPVTYTVTAADASTQQYVVTVTVAANPAKAITAFDFSTPAATGVVDEANKTVAITVPFGTAVTALTPTITHSGASVSPNSGAAQDFTNPVTYTVTAADASTQQYVVTVTVAANPAKAITAFDFAAPAATGVVNEGAKTVAITVPFGTAVTALTPTITHSGASVSPNSGAAQDFTNPVTYTVTAADTTTQQYVVTVTIAPEPVTAVGAVSGVAMDGQTLTAGAVTPGAATVDYRWQVSNDGVNGWSDISGANSSTYEVVLAKSAVGQYVRVVATGNGSYGGEVFSAAEKIQGMPTMVSVPAGTFQRDATLANTSFVSAFSMSAHEITRAQFARFMGTDPSDTAYSNGNADPVQKANWYHAIAFCNKLSLAEGLTPAYAVSGVNFSTLTYAEIPTSALSNTYWNAATCDWSANGYRLPTEMEWMWAAMGAAAAGQNGGTNTSGYSKAFAGNDGTKTLDACVWYFDNSSDKTHQAGTKLANELGLYDMSGNVLEWCWDWYSDNGTYPNYAISGAYTDYRGAGTGSYRVLRGGSFGYSAGGVTVANRDYGSPNRRNYGFGFRVVRSVITPLTAIGSVSGTPKSGRTLTAGALTPGYAAVNYQWQVSDNGSSDWSNIAGETANTYVVNLTKTAVGKYVRVTATGKDSYSGTFNSAATEILSAVITVVSVPAGTFQRDATANTSTVSGFRMSQHEVTRTQFSTIMGTDPSNTGYSSGMNDPVQQANWYHAIAFCNKLSLAEGLTPAYTISGSTDPASWGAVPLSDNTDWNAATCNWSANGYRLPTEMEWMWAAMGAPADGQGGGTNATGYGKAFAGSDGSKSIDAYAWYKSNSSNKTHTAGTKLANELGLYDMSGNVWEWCWDWYDSYPANSNSDYRGAGTGSSRVMRGGSWNNSDGSATVAYRNDNSPRIQYYGIGFRVVRP